jgi:hypothetical protein
MAGFWHLSHHQMRDPNGAVYAGALATFYEADTLNKITVYQDYGLGTEHPNPVAANAYGIFPPVFLDEADGFYRQRITSSGGVIIPGTDVGTLPVIGPGEGGGGAEVPVDANALFKTGDTLWLDQSGTRSGWVRDNGRTIGSTTSGASERANADTEALFLFLWAAYSDTVCPVNGGRGLTAAADFAANKTIGLPDKRGYVPGGLDDMGNTAASRYTGVPIISGSVTAAGSVIGATTHTLLKAEAPSGLITLNDPGHFHKVRSAGMNTTAGSNFELAQSGGNIANLDTEVKTTGITLTDNGGNAAHNNVQRTVLGTFYRKL